MNPLAGFYQRQLVDDCLPFWFPRAIDEKHGGFLHCFNRDGGLVDDDKSVWAQGRMSWMLLTLYQEFERRPAERVAEEVALGGKEPGQRFVALRVGQELRQRVLDDLPALARKRGAIFIKLDPEVILGTCVPGSETAV